MSGQNGQKDKSGQTRKSPLISKKMKIYRYYTYDTITNNFKLSQKMNRKDFLRFFNIRVRFNI